MSETEATGPQTPSRSLKRKSDNDHADGSPTKRTNTSSANERVEGERADTGTENDANSFSDLTAHVSQLDKRFATYADGPAKQQQATVSSCLGWEASFERVTAKANQALVPSCLEWESSFERVDAARRRALILEQSESGGRKAVDCRGWEVSYEQASSVLAKAASAPAPGQDVPEELQGQHTPADHVGQGTPPTGDAPHLSEATPKTDGELKADRFLAFLIANIESRRIMSRLSATVEECKGSYLLLAKGKGGPNDAEYNLRKLRSQSPPASKAEIVEAQQVAERVQMVLTMKQKEERTLPGRSMT
ncbi:hypothetical protein LTR85_002498 [Meristemomyces frigidus]|nr:hypothetical protein LTR85_002498 [Meristemomyces frigidus]